MRNRLLQSKISQYPLKESSFQKCPNGYCRLLSNWLWLVQCVVSWSSTDWVSTALVRTMASAYDLVELKATTENVVCATLSLVP